jgi:hypothetical protein
VAELLLALLHVFVMRGGFLQSVGEVHQPQVGDLISCLPTLKDAINGLSGNVAESLALRRIERSF